MLLHSDAGIRGSRRPGAWRPARSVENDSPFTMTQAGGPSPRVRTFVRWTLRHGRILWIVALALGVPAVMRTIYLYAHLHSEVEELLPLRAPSVQALEEMRVRFRSLQFLGVIADVPAANDLPAAERFMDDLALRLRQYPPDLIHDVRASNADVTAFLEQH